MKKIAAFFLLLIFSINWFGYRFIFDYAQHTNNLNLETIFDNELYDDAQLVELKIAMDLPYQTNRPVYERVDGEIYVEGILYKYVKRKVAYDTLYLMCLPNTKKMLLETAKNDFFKNWNEPDKNNTSNNAENGFSLLKQLQNILNESSLVIRIAPSSSDQHKNWFHKKTGSLLTSLNLSPEQPPDC
jgi:hypothetical protein